MQAARVYLDSIRSYHKQFKQAWDESRKLKFPPRYNDATDILIAGMGGSSFGGRILLSAFSGSDKNLLIPVQLVLGYNLPAYADEKTLVISTSYSGNTEEVLQTSLEGLSRGCKVVGITSGGKLGEAITKEKIPGYIFDPKHNPSSVPRTGIGYIVGATFGILSNLGYLSFLDKEAQELCLYLKKFIDSMQKDDITSQVAKEIVGKVPIFVYAEHLHAAAHIWRNFMNETAKSMGFVQEIPYMNHHFLDGLLFPKGTGDNFVFVYILSSLYSDRNKKRFQITREITRKQEIGDASVTLGGKSRLSEAWELIVIGSVIGCKLSDIYGVNPATNEMVDYLKNTLSGP